HGNYHGHSLASIRISIYPQISSTTCSLSNANYHKTNASEIARGLLQLPKNNVTTAQSAPARPFS
ncbi:MAG: hypothetical protein ABSH08_12195, partial [Tepidisphaeraceae bacterium]